MRSADTYRERCRAVAQTLLERNIDTLFVTPSADLQYLTGYPAHASERPTIFALSHTGRAVLMLPRFEAARLGSMGEIEIVTYEEREDPYRVLGGALSLPSGCVCAVSDRAWAAVLLKLQYRWGNAEFVAASPVMRGVRMRKSADELEAMRQAARRADAALAAILCERFLGRTEEEIAGRLGARLDAEGLARADWGPIVASGPNSASPHHVPGDRRIAEGDTVLLDFGGIWDGYNADITRTVHVGPPDDAFVAVYDTVRGAQQAGVDAVAPGATAAAVDAAARKVIESAGYGEYFVHRTGHGLGLETHEEPYLVAGNDLALAPGMTFSVEPGVYLPGQFGVRIEDAVAVTPSSGERLNLFPRELIVVE